MESFNDATNTLALSILPPYHLWQVFREGKLKVILLKVKCKQKYIHMYKTKHIMHTKTKEQKLLDLSIALIMCHFPLFSN